MCRTEGCFASAFFHNKVCNKFITHKLVCDLYLLYFCSMEDEDIRQVIFSEKLLNRYLEE